jgi:site-specific DNA-methyltransferase (adenine-specific)
VTTFALYSQDAVEWMDSLPAESANLLFADPAYETLERHRAVGTTTRLKREWFEIFPNSRFPAFFKSAYRVLAKNAHAYVMCDQETAFYIRPIGEAAGFRFWKPVIWHKTGGLGMGYHWRASYEMILFFEKGKRRLNDLGQPDLIPYPKVRNAYPTEKPVGLIEKFISNSSLPGEVVIDPFVGSGATGEAACKLGRVFMGSDISTKAVEISRARLSAIATEVTPTFETKSLVV